MNMELSKRPIPDIPSDPKQLAEAVRVKFEGALTELEKLLDEVSEEEDSLLYTIKLPIFVLIHL